MLALRSAAPRSVLPMPLSFCPMTPAARYHPRVAVRRQGEGDSNCRFSRHLASGLHRTDHRTAISHDSPIPPEWPAQVATGHKMAPGMSHYHALTPMPPDQRGQAFCVQVGGG